MSGIYPALGYIQSPTRSPATQQFSIRFPGSLLHGEVDIRTRDKGAFSRPFNNGKLAVPSIDYSVRLKLKPRRLALSRRGCLVTPQRSTKT
jgi:hypothetical protein